MVIKPKQLTRFSETEWEIGTYLFPPRFFERFADGDKVSLSLRYKRRRKIVPGHIRIGYHSEFDTEYFFTPNSQEKMTALMQGT